MKRSILSAGVLVLLTLPQAAWAQHEDNEHETLSSISRVDTVNRGRQFARHRWHASAGNIAPTRCPANFDWHSSTGVQTYAQISSHYVGDFIGLPYNWGGSMPLSKFDSLLAQNWSAGAGASTNLEVRNCTIGVDCSGFVSQAWRINYYATTRALPSASNQLSNVSQMLAGDIWNMAGYHTAMFTQTLANGIPESVESVNYNVNINRYGGYAGVGQFVPLRYKQISGATAGVGPKPGTLEQPIVIQPSSTTDVNTAAGVSAYASYGGACPNTAEGGPEVVFQVTFPSAGSFTATISDDATGDLDVHILSQLNTTSCLARGNTTATAQVGAGTYYVIVDTFGTAANAGAGELIVSFTAGGSTPAPTAFEPKGGAGEECNNEVWCDVNRDGEACLRTSQTSGFCSKSCDSNADCANMAGGAGCCGNVTVTDSEGNERTEKYCYIASYCEGGQPSSSGAATSSSGASGSNGTSGSNGSNGGGDDDGDDDGTGNGGDDDGNGASPDGEGSSGSKKKSSEGGCAASPASNPASALVLIGLGLTALAARRRRRA